MKRAFVLLGLVFVSSAAMAQTNAREPLKSARLACNAPAPTALLDGSAYRDYRSGPETTDTFYESITLSDGVKLQIRNIRCTDTDRQEFLLTVAQPDHDKTDVAYWSGYLANALSALKARDDSKDVVTSMRNFLAKAPTYPARGSNVEICRDSTLPRNGECGAKTGGTYSFEIRKVGATLVVKAQQSS